MNLADTPNFVQSQPHAEIRTHDHFSCVKKFYIQLVPLPSPSLHLMDHPPKWQRVVIPCTSMKMPMHSTGTHRLSPTQSQSSFFTRQPQYAQVTNAHPPRQSSRKPYLKHFKVFSLVEEEEFKKTMQSYHLRDAFDEICYNLQVLKVSEEEQIQSSPG